MTLHLSETQAAGSLLRGTSATRPLPLRPIAYQGPA
jgi:hypothetical protein